MPSGVTTAGASVALSVPGKVRPKNVERFVADESAVPSQGGFQLASFESETVSLPARRDDDADLATSSVARSSGRARAATFDERFGGGASSFNDRFAGMIEWPSSPQADQREDVIILPPTRDLGGHAPARRGAASPVRVASLSPTLPPVSPLKKQVQSADLSEDLNPSAPADADDIHTAIYDISAHRVYMPDGKRLEAHSGLGSHIDDPRYVGERDRGPTPPNVYELSLREEIFHGVRALRLTPIGNGKMYGRDGLLAHSYMLGASGQSNGCVSFDNYQAFLNAYLSGDVTRLVVVDHLATPPSPKVASGWIPESIRALFGRS